MKLGGILLTVPQHTWVWGEIDAYAKLRLPWLLNIGFLGVMRIERFFISLGINFALGGPRLIVARKVKS